MISFGQVSTHFLQPMQIRLSIRATPSAMQIAPVGQTAAQSPQPRHPYRQAPGPPNSMATARQLSIPSYCALAGEAVQVPLQ